MFPPALAPLMRWTEWIVWFLWYQWNVDYWGKKQGVGRNCVFPPILAPLAKGIMCEWLPYVRVPDLTVCGDV